MKTQSKEQKYSEQVVIPGVHLKAALKISSVEIERLSPLRAAMTETEM